MKNKGLLIMNKNIKIEANRFIIDGNDVTKYGEEGEEKPRMANLIDMYNFLMGEGATKVEIYVDVSLTNKIDDKSLLNDMIQNAEAKRVPGREDAERWILITAKKLDAFIITNQKYDLGKFEGFDQDWFDSVRISYEIEDHHITLKNVKIEEVTEDKPRDLPVDEKDIIHKWEGIFFQLASFKTVGYRLRGTAALTKDKIVFKGTGRGGKLPFVFKKYNDKLVEFNLSEIKEPKRISSISFSMRNGFAFKIFVNSDTQTLCRFIISQNDDESNELFVERVDSIYEDFDKLIKGEEIDLPKRCKYCGAKIREGAKFCHACGKKI
ncbi:MAG: zinc-ribbon domain-containing protein [Candidatus Lokiarchaeota archaeon]|nr:zinc-ribbon domain-containing protein [Candidatus Lokiarchaeota archaeon]